MAPKHILAVFVVVAAFGFGCSGAFRADYTYINSLGAYYKFHREATHWILAKATCETEGAWLYHPENQFELGLVAMELDVRDVINSGISHLENLGEYETIDGRPISQVYSKWRSGEPNSGTGNKERCARLDSSNELFLGHCDSNSWTFPFICKFRQNLQAVVTTAIEEGKTIIGHVNDKLVDALNIQGGAMQVQIGNTTQELVNAVATLTETLQQQSANQTRSLERLADSVASQAVASNRRSETLMRQLVGQSTALMESMQAQAANVSAVLTRQALALENLQSQQDNSNQIDVRSEQ